MKQQRDIYIDIVKGLAITLVVLGHCIQFGSRDFAGEQYYDNFLFQWIYSFHMPLFMLVSGFLFNGSLLRHPWSYNLRTRFTNLLVPVVAWNTLYLLTVDGYLLLKGGDVPVGSQLLSYFSNIWFLWAVLFCSLAVMVINRKLNDSVAAYLLLGVLLLALPNSVASLYIYMYPYFVVGYLWGKYRMGGAYESLGKPLKLSLLVAALALFAVLFLAYDRNDFIYTTGTCVIAYGESLGDASLNTPQLGVDLYRYLIGFVGAMALLMLIKFVRRLMDGRLHVIDSVLSKLGRASIGIYIISVLFVNLLLLPHLPHKEQLGDGSAVVETMVVLAVTYFVTKALEKNRITRKILLGGR